MKEIKMFVLGGCPHCRKAKGIVEDLLARNPQYREIPLKEIDEGVDEAYADKFDYYYVPTFYVGDEKVHEGLPVTEEAIEAVFLKALGK